MGGDGAKLLGNSLHYLVNNAVGSSIIDELTQTHIDMHYPC